MMSVRLMFPLILFLLLEVDGVKRVMPDIDVYPRDVTEDDVGGSGSDEADEIPCCNLDIDSNDTEYDSSGSGGDEVDEIPCCNSGNYTFYSIVDALNSVTSNTIIKVSTDVVLPSNVMLEGLDNITIIGVGIPTVNCNDTGSVKFVSCNNVIIEGVNWEMCGSNKFPGIEFYDSSIISIQSCSFQHSRRQAVALSKVSGNVFINNCQFTHNKYHKGHGVAIYYTSSPEQSTQVQLVINNCNFSLNGPAKSTVFVSGDSNNRVVNKHIFLLQNSTFIQNQGIPIYIFQTNLILKNNVSVKNNRAIAGGGIYTVCEITSGHRTISGQLH